MKTKEVFFSFLFSNATGLLFQPNIYVTQWDVAVIRSPTKSNGFQVILSGIEGSSVL